MAPAANGQEDRALRAPEAPLDLYAHAALQTLVDDVEDEFCKAVVQRDRDYAVKDVVLGVTLTACYKSRTFWMNLPNQV